MPKTIVELWEDVKDASNRVMQAEDELGEAKDDRAAALNAYEAAGGDAALARVMRRRATRKGERDED